MSDEKAILLSVLPTFAYQILDGTKKWEYRKRAPKIEEKTKMFLYASGDVGAIIGECVVTKVIQMPVEELIENTIDETPSSKEGVRAYFAGHHMGSALRVEEPEKYGKPITLLEIIDRIPGFAVPQNFYYLRKDDLKFSPLLRMIESREKTKIKM